MMRERAVAVLVALSVVGWTACRKAPTPEQRMAGSWRAREEAAANPKQDPLARGIVRFFSAGPLETFLEVGPGTIETRRNYGGGGPDVVQRATYERVGPDRIALSTDGCRSLFTL